MKTKLSILLCLLLMTTSLVAEVIFYDDFNRSNGEVGNNWTNVGPGVNAEIENGVMKIEAGFNRGINRTFATIQSGIYYIQYDWKFSESDWFVSSFPSDIPVQLLWEYTGAIYTDATGYFNNSTLIGNRVNNTWINVRWKVNLDNNQYSIWLDDSLVLENYVSNTISLFNSFNFRTSNGSFGTQYVDNFLVFDNTAPQIPTGLSASASVNEITINWNELENTDFITYRIYRSLTSPATNLVAEVSGDETQYIDRSVNANTDYYYRIKAVSLNTVESAFSQEISSHLSPLPVLTPDSFELNIGVANPNEIINFSLQNSGAYQLNYSLSGTDELAPENQLMEISGFVPMGTYNGHTYYRSNSTMSWQSAKLLCEQEGGHLVTISNLAENTFVYENSSPSSWLGFTDENSEGNWQWITGEPVNFTYWLPNEPNNSNNEDYAQMGHTSPYYKWNDNANDTNNNSHAILEFDFLFPPSILVFSQNSGILEAGDFNDFNISVDGSILEDGSYETSIRLEVEAITEAFYFPVTINVDFNPPLQVTGLVTDSNNTNANQIGISWNANATSDQVSVYRIFRMGRHETDWTMLGEVSASQLTYIDNQFTPLDTTYVYYSVQAEDWVGNVSELSETIIASLERYLAPENLQIVNLDDRDIQLTWTPVTQTIAGVAGTPSCYIIYKSQNPSPLSDFDFLAVSLTANYTHEWALYFQPADRLYYIVTAYGGDMQRLNRVLSKKEVWKKSELEEKIRVFRIQD